jgi:hypothetical protein
MLTEADWHKWTATEQDRIFHKNALEAYHL